MSSRFMNDTVIQRRRGAPPLPIRNGLNPTRARVPEGNGPITAWDFISAVIASQRHRDPEDGDEALSRRFDQSTVVDARGMPLSPDTPLAEGQDVWFYRHPAPETPIPYALQLVHQDERLLVVDKPPFMATMPRGQHITQTATVILRRQTDNDDLSPAHRLDRLTSGLLIFVQRPEDRGAYQTLFARREVSKTYQAIAPAVEQLVTSAPIVWQNRIEKVPGEFQAKVVEGLPNAVTTLTGVQPMKGAELETIQRKHGTREKLGKYTLQPLTGKTHQLRLHMWLAGAPILGDNAYPEPQPAGEENFDVPLELRATSLEFTDPFTGKPRAFTV